MIKNTKIKNYIFLFLIFAAILSCEEESDAPVLNEVNTSATVTFNPSNISWYLRQFPDSVKINISNGNSPYVIINRPEFSSEAIVKNNQLILYPNSAFESRLGNDFVVIQDNSGNVNSFNIQVESLEHYYDSIVEFFVEVVGDTSFTTNQSSYGFSTAWWDEYSKELNSGISMPGLVQTFLKNVSDTGSVSFTHNYDIAVISNPSLPVNKRFEFILNDLGQTANIKVLNRNEFKVEAEVNLVDANNNFTGNHLVKIKVHAVKN